MKSFLLLWSWRATKKVSVISSARWHTRSLWSQNLHNQYNQVEYVNLFSAQQFKLPRHTGGNRNKYTYINCSYNKRYATHSINKYKRTQCNNIISLVWCERAGRWRHGEVALWLAEARGRSVYHQSSELELHVLARATDGGGSSWSKIQIYLFVFTTASIKALTAAAGTLCGPTLNHWNRSVAFMWRFLVLFWTKERAKDSSWACWVQLIDLKKLVCFSLLVVFHGFRAFPLSAHAKTSRWKPKSLLLLTLSPVCWEEHGCFQKNSCNSSDPLWKKLWGVRKDRTWAFHCLEVIQPHHGTN